MKIETTEERLRAMGRVGPNPDGSISLGDAVAVGFLRDCECGNLIAAWSPDVFWIDERSYCAKCAAHKGVAEQLAAEIAAHAAKLGSLTHLLQLTARGEGRMTEEDFIVIADILLELRPLFSEDQFKNIVYGFAISLKNRYPQFDPETFRRYIGSR